MREAILLLAKSKGKSGVFLACLQKIPTLPSESEHLYSLLGTARFHNFTDPEGAGHEANVSTWQEGNLAFPDWTSADVNGNSRPRCPPTTPFPQDFTPDTKNTTHTPTQSSCNQRQQTKRTKQLKQARCSPTKSRKTRKARYLEQSVQSNGSSNADLCSQILDKNSEKMESDDGCVHSHQKVAQ
jgi:hypothetical protein